MNLRRGAGRVTRKQLEGRTGTGKVIRNASDAAYGLNLASASLRKLARTRQVNPRRRAVRLSELGPGSLSLFG